MSMRVRASVLAGMQMQMQTHRCRLMSRLAAFVALVLALVVTTIPPLMGAQGRAPAQQTPARAPAGAPVQQAPTLILHGGKVVTRDANNPEATAVAIQGDRIQMVGTDAEVLARKGTATKVVDLKGRVVLPSFKPQHEHVEGGGFEVLNEQLPPDKQLFLDMRGLNKDQIIARLKEKASQVPAGTWIEGRRGAGGVALDELSKAVPNNPVALGIGGHHLQVNAAAMRLAKITKDTPDPPMGRIVRDANGEPTGMFLERATELIHSIFPVKSDQSIKDAFRAGARALAAEGVTATYEMGFFAEGTSAVSLYTVDQGHILKILTDLDREGGLPIDINVVLLAPSKFADDVLKHPGQLASLPSSPHVRVTGVKVWVDGGVSSTTHSGLLTFPYRDNPEEGMGWCCLTPSQVFTWALHTVDAGLDFHAHCMGDGAVRQTLDAYEGILKVRPDVKPERLVIEHFGFATAADIARTARLGVVADLQPNFARGNQQGMGGGMEVLGPENAVRQYPARDLHDLGAWLAFSTDSYDGINNMFEAFFFAVSRKGGPGFRPYYPSQRLSREATLEAFTDWRLPFGKGRVKGVIAPGQLADLMVVSGNPLTVAEDEIAKIKVSITLKEGEATYSDEPALPIRSSRPSAQ